MLQLIANATVSERPDIKLNIFEDSAAKKNLKYRDLSFVARPSTYRTLRPDIFMSTIPIHFTFFFLFFLHNYNRRCASTRYSKFDRVGEERFKSRAIANPKRGQFAGETSDLITLSINCRTSTLSCFLRGCDKSLHDTLPPHARTVINFLLRSTVI